MRTLLPESWMEHLSLEFEKDYMKKVKNFLAEEIINGKTIYPHDNEIFSALELTSFDQVKVVIVGQDPYHGPNQAHGLCFSVKHGVVPPPSLMNIYKELNTDLEITPAKHGCLVSWAMQGVLLLNSVLTVEAHKPLSHRGKGWEIFTDKVIEILNTRREKLVFLLWGAFAQKKCATIDRKKHYVLETVHPSPLSAHRGFLGCKHFSKTNFFLAQNGLSPIAWKLPEAP